MEKRYFHDQLDSRVRIGKRSVLLEQQSDIDSYDTDTFLLPRDEAIALAQMILDHYGEQDR